MAKPKSSTTTSTLAAPRVYTLDEAAGILRICRGSAYRGAKRGDIPTVKVGGRILVPAVALEKLLGSAG